MIDFLTKEELAELVGTRYRKVQERWLRERGWPYETNSKGGLLVLRSVAMQNLGDSTPVEMEVDLSTIK